VSRGDDLAGALVLLVGLAALYAIAFQFVDAAPVERPLRAGQASVWVSP